MHCGVIPGFISVSSQCQDPKAYFVFSYLDALCGVCAVYIIAPCSDFVSNSLTSLVPDL